MRVFVIDTSNMGPELQGGLIGVVGSASPSAEEKKECVETVSRYAVEGWAVAADPMTPMGRLAALIAEAACVPFVRMGGPRLAWKTLRTMGFTRSPEQDSTGLGTSPIPASPAETRTRGLGQLDAHVENGGR